MAKENKGSKLRKMLSEGCISENYTLNGYFFKVYPYFNIDKVKFSFVEKGKSGTGFDIYVDTDEFTLLCIDIDERKFDARLAADNGPYPGAWKYITGENAARELAIGKSQKGGVVVQGRNKEEKKQAFVPIQYKELRKMALLYLVVSGLKPVTGYYAELRELFIKGVERISKYHGAQDTQPVQQRPTPTVVAKPVPQAVKAAPSTQGKQETSGNGHDKKTAAESSADVKNIVFRTCQNMQTVKGGYRIMVRPITDPDDSKMKYLYISDEKSRSEFKSGEFDLFKEMTEKTAVKIRLIVKESPSYYVFLKRSPSKEESTAASVKPPVEQQPEAASIANPAPAAGKATPSTQEKQEEAKDVTPSSRDNEKAAETSSPAEKFIGLKTYNAVEPTKGGYRIMVRPVTEHDSKMKYLYIPNDKIRSEFKHGEFDRLKKMAETGSVNIRLFVKENPNYYLFLRMPTKAS